MRSARHDRTTPLRGACLPRRHRAKVIEVNPRLTASPPIPHLLARQAVIARHIGGGFRIEAIDLRTRIRVPYGLIESGELARSVFRTWEEDGVLVLPQGLNPFGDSRLVFVNDDEDASAQRRFLGQLERSSADLSEHTDASM